MNIWWPDCSSCFNFALWCVTVLLIWFFIIFNDNFTYGCCAHLAWSKLVNWFWSNGKIVHRDKMLMSIMQRRSDKDFYANPSWTSALTKHWNIKLTAALKRLCICMGLLRIYIICGWVFHFLSKPSLSGDCDRCPEQTFEFIGDGIHAVNALVFMDYLRLYLHLDYRLFVITAVLLLNLRLIDFIHGREHSYTPIQWYTNPFNLSSLDHNFVFAWK